jgi:murein DD-endopeptidase MepM/ murein hydrolase activator NlpD
MAVVQDYVLKNPRVTSGYGKRTHPITGEKNKMHNGVDLTSSDKNIYALEDGYAHIVVTGKDNATTGYGNYLWVRYPRIGISLLHAHCKTIKLKKGDKVKKGDIIAVMGKTGAATGVHLHLGMQPIGKSNWINPQTYDYIPPVEQKEEPKQDFEKVIEELNKKIEDLNLEVKNLNDELIKAKTELDEEKIYKFSHKVESNGRYSIDLNIDEILIVK